jgi:hypothetical protein
MESGNQDACVLEDKRTVGGEAGTVGLSDSSDLSQTWLALEMGHDGTESTSTNVHPEHMEGHRATILVDLESLKAPCYRRVGASEG